MDKRQYQMVTLAGLLHDVGKLIRSQPSAIQATKPYGHAPTHALDGVSLLRYLGAEKLTGWPILEALVAHHHDRQWPDQYALPGRLISKSDHFSSRERLDAQDLEDTDAGDPFERRKSPKPTAALDSIFGQPSYGYAQPEPQYYRAAPLTTFSAFPQKNRPGESQFTDIVDEFVAAAQALLQNVDDPSHLTVAFTDLLGRYAASVNTDKGTPPFDISLYDHLSTTAAIAACQYIYHEGTAQWTAEAIEDEDLEKFLLVGGDLSGIQSYLYAIARIGGGGVARRLRARSFYLTALLRVTAFRILQEVSEDFGVALPNNCKLMVTGGRFLLLLPNLPEVRARLAALDGEINRWLRAETHSDLAIYLVTTPLRGRDFVTEQQMQGRTDPGSSTITARVAEIDTLLQEAKEQRYHSLLRSGDAWHAAGFVERQTHVHYRVSDGDNEGGACRSCNKLPAIIGPLCVQCNRDGEMGSILVRTNYLGYRRGPATSKPTYGCFDLAFFTGDGRYTLRLARNGADLDLFAPQYSEYLDMDALAFVRNGTADPFAVREEEARQVGYRHALMRSYLANYVPVGETGELITFDELAERSGRADGPLGVEPYLGVVRMDVDQLGFLISQGLGAATSISRLATFSRMLDLFFSGWVDTKLRQVADHRGRPIANPLRDLYTVYAGGDDLLLVGPWDRVVDAARALQADFTRYTANNPNLAISAAVLVSKPRFPVAKTAQRSGALLDNYAKRGGGNRLHLFGVTAPWYHRSPTTVDEVHKQLVDNQGIAVDDLWAWAELFDREVATYVATRAEDDGRHPISNAFLHRLLRLAEMSRDIDLEGRSSIGNLTYMALLAYHLGRRLDPQKYPVLSEKLMELTQLHRRQEMAHMRMPLTWALLRNRERSN